MKIYNTTKDFIDATPSKNFLILDISFLSTLLAEMHVYMGRRLLSCDLPGHSVGNRCYDRFSLKVHRNPDLLPWDPIRSFLFL